MHTIYGTLLYTMMFIYHGKMTRLEFIVSVYAEFFFIAFFFYLLNHSTALADILSTLKLLHILCMYESNRGNCQYDNNNTQWTVCNGWNLKMKALEINHHFTFLMHACMHAAARCFFPFSFSSRCAEQTNKI